MKTNLFIPKKVVVGFQNRTDTFTGKLAYVVYYDEKGVLRQEHSWNGWRDKNITQVEFDNVPTRFVINKGVDRYGYFGSGRSVARIYDTRDHEFEISISNLMGILMYSDVSKRDILEECVYAWSGKDLILLPVNSNEYQESLEYTAKQSLKFSTKNLVKGYTYSAKKNSSTYVYIGYYDYYELNRYYYINISTFNQTHKGKKHIFYNTENNDFCTISVSTLAECISDNIYPSYADLVQQYETSVYNKLVSKFSTSFIPCKEYYKQSFNNNYNKNNINYETFILGKDFYKIENDIIYHISIGYDYNDVNLNYISVKTYSFKTKKIVTISDNTIYPDDRYGYKKSNTYTLNKFGISKDINNEITCETFIKHLLDIGYQNNILLLDEQDNILHTFDKLK